MEISIKLPSLVFETICFASEKSPEQAVVVGELLHRYISIGLVSLHSFTLVLASILEHVEDVKAGIPYIWKILGGILGPMVAIEEGTFPLSELTTFVKPRMNSSDFNLLVMEAVAASGKFSTSHYEKMNGKRKLKGATSLKELLTQKTQPSLKKSENAWVLWSEYSKNLSPEEVEKEELLRKARGILNKLTPQKFEKLVEMMKSLNINTGDKLKGVIDLIFEKALLEPIYSKLYARLCDALAKQELEIENGSNFTFKRMLLNKCQKEFEKERTDEQQLEKEQDKHFENAEEEKAWQEELSLRRYLAKKRSLGNIRFIGELFKLKMLAEAIIHACLCKLLNDRNEESLECLCQLLTTIGKDIDHEKAKVIARYSLFLTLVDACACRTFRFYSAALAICDSMFLLANFAGTCHRYISSLH